MDLQTLVDNLEVYMEYLEDVNFCLHYLKDFNGVHSYETPKQYAYDNAHGVNLKQLVASAFKAGLMVAEEYYSENVVVSERPSCPYDNAVLEKIWTMAFNNGTLEY